MKNPITAWLKPVILLTVIVMSLAGCGANKSGAKAVALPRFPAFPELSDEFYQKAPPADLDKLLRREWNLTAWQRMAEDRVK